MRTSLRVTLAAACAAGLAAAPAAAALDTAIRVEGASANLIPERDPDRGLGTATVFDRNFAPVDVSRASAFWQLYRATSSTGLGIGFEHFPAFSALLVQRIGPDENAGVVGWQYRVNHAAPAVGADQRALGQGDSVLWYYGAPDGARELDVALGRPGGGRRQLQRRRHELRGRRRGPARSGRHGHLRRRHHGGGRRRAGDVRRPGRGHADRQRHAGGRHPQRRAPGLLVRRRAIRVQPAARALARRGGPDNRGHGRARQPHHAPAHRLPSAHRGGDPRRRGPGPLGRRPGRGGARRRVGTQCRFRPVRRPHRAPAVLAPALPEGTDRRRLDWTLGLGKGLAPGLWRVWSRAVDGAGTASASACRACSGQFRVER